MSAVNNAMALTNRRTAYLRNKNALTKNDVKAAIDSGITREQFYQGLHMALLLKNQNKKKETRLNAKNRKTTRDLANELTELVEPKPEKQEREVQISFRIFREDTNNVLRLEDLGQRAGRDRHQRFAQDYIQVGGQNYEEDNIEPVN